MVLWINREDLSFDEKEAIWYFYNFGININRYLRNPGLFKEDPYYRFRGNHYRLCINLDNAINKTVVTNSSLLFRGLSGPFIEELYEESLQINKILHEPGYTSWTVNREIAYEYALSEGDNGVVFTIKTDIGEHLLDLESCDSEVIYPRRMSWEIISKRISHYEGYSVTLIALKRYIRQ